MVCNIWLGYILCIIVGSVSYVIHELTYFPQIKSIASSWTLYQMIISIIENFLKCQSFIVTLYQLLYIPIKQSQPASPGENHKL